MRSPLPLVLTLLVIAAAQDAPAVEVRFVAGAAISNENGISRPVAMGDVDRDGDMDLVAASGANGSYDWYENVAGDGSAWTRHPIGAASVPYVADLADLDGDGDLDVVAQTASTTLAWFENSSGDGATWSGAQTVSLAASDTMNVVHADLDRDGDLDLAAARFGSSLVWYENAAGDGSAWTSRGIATPADCCQTVRAGDFDRDGDPDLAVTSYTSDTVLWYANDGTPGSVGAGDWQQRTIDSAADGADGLALADVDRDGDLDALFSPPPPTVFWSENRRRRPSGTASHGRGRRRSGLRHAADPTPTAARSLIVSARHRSRGRMGHGDEAGPRHAHSAVGGPEARADPDGDGDLDVFTLRPPPRDLWRRTDLHRNAALPSRRRRDAARLRVGFPRRLRWRRRWDLLSAANGSGSIAWHENDAGDGSSWSSHAIGTITNARMALASDVDRDGDLDVVASGSIALGGLLWFENTAGDGSAWSSHTIGPTFPQALRFALADVDADGDVDVFVGSLLGAPTTALLA
jgi:hypothetical protein